MSTKSKRNILIPLDLIEAIRKQECVLFVASGLSSMITRTNGKNIPGWKNFLLELLAWCQDNRAVFNSDPNEIGDMISKGNFLMAAQELQEIINPGEFTSFLNSIFRDRNVKPTQTHISLAKIPFRAVLTTNYDALLEGAYAIANGGIIPNTYTQLDTNTAINLLRKKDYFIFKMHGDIDSHKTVVLGSLGYNELLHNNPGYLGFLETLFTTQTVLFLGFGGSDPDLDFVLDRLSTIYSKTLNRHFILLPEKKFNFTEKRRLLLDRRLEVIEYNSENNHAEVDLFVQRLSRIVEKLQYRKSRKKSKYNIMLVSLYKDIEIIHKIEPVLKESNNYNFVSWQSMDSIFNIDEEFIDSDADNDDDYLEELRKLKNDNDIDVLLLLLTKQSLSFKDFESDIDFLLLKEIEINIPVIIVTVGEVSLPLKLKNKHHIKVSKDLDSNDMDTIIEGIRNVL
ncbi:SIR2 family protein [Larkinella bovis]|uniref:SIR2 family protein n=1 Tax=Larkinella bovis TaxID=683041 RepID=A0ABW0I9B9_9BACT